MQNVFEINGRKIGHGEPCFIVAEISANHNQDIEKAKAIIKAAKVAGADAVKLQTYTADTLTLNSDQPHFKVSAKGLWTGRTLYDLYQEAHTPWDWHAELFETAREEGLICFSTPFDRTAVELLERLNAPVHKVASFEIVDLGLLKEIGATGKPVIMSTGMATKEEIGEAVNVLRDAGVGEIVLLKCTSAYPASPSSMNLKTIPHLAEHFNVLSGLSDHTLGGTVAVAAVAIGACVVEKHFTLSRADKGPDSAFSMEPAEFSQMVEDIRMVESALGVVSYERTEEEKNNLSFRRSLFIVEDVKAGEVLTMNNIRSIRPGNGLAPRHLESILG